MEVLPGVHQAQGEHLIRVAWEINMDASNITLKTNLNQNTVYIRGYGSHRAKPIRATRVDIEQQIYDQVKWLFTWLMIFPLGVFAITWFLLMAIDLLII